MSKNKNVQPRKEVLIDNQSTFIEWSISIRKFRLENDFVTYNLELPELSPDENQMIGNQINRYNNACGCETGSLFMSLTLISIVAAYFISGGKFSTITFSQVIWGAGITLVAALAGKGIGLIFARWKLIKLSESLAQRLNINYTHSRITQVN